ncbi:Uncharacterised protein [Cedecea neteri]|uniref:Uncharacterized protein n=1 Tax=Cedecea neteri TaxID=158822 RepID=A0A2X2T9L1_9ENTR|nr:Uncharacterised protein [Cedecea neteri]
MPVIYPPEEGRDVFTIWQRNFVHYHFLNILHPPRLSGKTNPTALIIHYYNGEIICDWQNRGIHASVQGEP